MKPQFVCETHQGRTLNTKSALRWLALGLSLVFCLVSASPIAAQSVTTLNATVAGLGCNTSKGANQFSVLSFSWGASNPTTVKAGGMSAGKVSVSSFNVMKLFDSCSPALFGGVVSGKTLPTLTMVQLDQKNVVLMTVTLSQVFVESIQWSASEGGPQTTESVSFAFAKACIQDMPSGSKVCYDPTAIP
jgi:type VI secretion system secreted protein Hcp